MLRSVVALTSVISVALLLLRLGSVSVAESTDTVLLSSPMAVGDAVILTVRLAPARIAPSEQLSDGNEPVLQLAPLEI